MDIKERQELNQKFKDVYERDILPILEKMEPYRMKELKKFRIIKSFLSFLPMFALILIIFCFVIPKLLFLSFLFIVISAFSVVKYMFYVKEAPKKFSKFVKNRCMSKILPCFDNLYWMSNQVDSLIFMASGLFPDFMEIVKDDIFDGIYKDVKFHIEEVCLINSRSKQSFNDVFKGIIIIMPSNKTFQTQTIISSKGDGNVYNLQPNAIFSIIVTVVGMAICAILAAKSVQKSLTGEVIEIIIGLIFGLVTLGWLIIDTVRKSKRYQKIKLEDINFDKQFVVSSEDQVEARYLVTTAFMERLQNLQTAFGTKDIKCSFFDNNVMFAISTEKDLFEFADLYTPLPNPNQINQLKQELMSIYDMIDYFKLAEKTGL